MYCQKCGRKLNDDMLFCDRCGTPTINYVSSMAENKPNEKNRLSDNPQESTILSKVRWNIKHMTILICSVILLVTVVLTISYVKKPDLSQEQASESVQDTVQKSRYSEDNEETSDNHDGFEYQSDMNDGNTDSYSDSDNEYAQEKPLFDFDWHTYTIETEDANQIKGSNALRQGYKLLQTWTLSPWIQGTNRSIAETYWNEISDDPMYDFGKAENTPTGSIPSLDDLDPEDYYLAVGTFKTENITQGFDLSETKQAKCAQYIAAYSSVKDGEHRKFKQGTTVCLGYPVGGGQYKVLVNQGDKMDDFFGSYDGNPHWTLTSNCSASVPFILLVINEKTPDEPDGKYNMEDVVLQLKKYGVEADFSEDVELRLPIYGKEKKGWIDAEDKVNELTRLAYAIEFHNFMSNRDHRAGKQTFSRDQIVSFFEDDLSTSVYWTGYLTDETVWNDISVNDFYVEISELDVERTNVMLQNLLGITVSKTDFDDEVIVSDMGVINYDDKLVKYIGEIGWGDWGEYVNTAEVDDYVEFKVNLVSYDEVFGEVILKIKKADNDYGYTIDGCVYEIYENRN